MGLSSLLIGAVGILLMLAVASLLVMCATRPAQPEPGPEHPAPPPTQP